MQTIFLLMARYDAQPMITIDQVRQDFFNGMHKTTFSAKLESGEIPLPVARLGSGQKAVKMIGLQDLAAYLDAASEAARRELRRKA